MRPKIPRNRPKSPKPSKWANTLKIGRLAQISQKALKKSLKPKGSRNVTTHPKNRHKDPLKEPKSSQIGPKTPQMAQKALKLVQKPPELNLKALKIGPKPQE